MTTWWVSGPALSAAAELQALLRDSGVGGFRLDIESAGSRAGIGDVAIICFQQDEEVSARSCATLRACGARVLLFVPRGAEPSGSLVDLCDDLVWSGASSGEFRWRCSRLATDGDVEPRPHSGTDFDRHGLYGEAPAFLEALALLDRFASCEAPLLIEGETGTGKELAARAAHYLGRRRDGPFVPVNCGALPDMLLENELFGHRAGAYTGGGEAAEGLVVRAHLGTLFLDEIDALSMRAQAALLRFLQSGEYRPLGSGRLRTVDCRVIAASNTSLEHTVELGAMREDLYYRLAVAVVVLPPLRERPGDAALLASRFLEECSADVAQPRRFAPEVLSWVDAQSWRGNVRALRAFVERQVLLGDDRVIRRVEPSGGATTPSAPTRFARAKAEAVAAFEERYLRRVLREAGENVSEAARLAGKERRTFSRLLAKYGILPRQVHRVRARRSELTPARGRRPS